MTLASFGAGELGAVAIRTFIVLVLLVAALRVISQRPAGGLRSFDILVILLMASAVQSSMTKNSGHITVSLVSAGVLLVSGWLAGVVIGRWPSMQQRLSGSPVVLLKDGQVDKKALQAQDLTEDDLQVAARKHGLDDISHARLAVFEVDGSISVIANRHSQQSR